MLYEVITLKLPVNVKLPVWVVFTVLVSVPVPPPVPPWVKLPTMLITGAVKLMLVAACAEIAPPAWASMFPPACAEMLPSAVAPISTPACAEMDSYNFV